MSGRGLEEVGWQGEDGEDGDDDGDGNRDGIWYTTPPTTSVSKNGLFHS